MLLKNAGFLTLVACGAVSLNACGSSSDSTGSAGAGAASAGGAGGSDDGCALCSHPPDLTPGAPDGDGPGQTFAVKNLDLGGDGSDPNHWKVLGYDLDGRKSNTNSTDHCKLVGVGTPAFIKTDGNNGIDNSFGANILSALPSETQSKVDDAIMKGEFTILIQIDKLGAKTDYLNLPAALYAGAARMEADAGVDAGSIPPTWSGTDEWPVSCELLQSCLVSETPQLPVNSSKVQFLNSYVKAGTWVSGTKGDGILGLSLSVAGYALNLTIHRAIISAKLGTETPVATSGSNGIVAGILKTEEVLGSLQQVAGKLNSNFCQGEALASFVDQVKGASDIMVDGTQDPTKTCDGISIGLGFNLGAAKVGKVLDKATPGGDPCADAAPN
jgi:hypothetical protein